MFKTLLYNQIYINIVAGNKKTTIYVEEISFNGSTYNYEKVFESSEKQKINSFIAQNVKKSPIHYISLLDNSESQGATPTCSSSNMAQFCDMGAVNHICYTKNWGYYTSKLDILELKNKYKTIGLDFIFSPFLLLANFFKDKIDSGITMYILINENLIILSVFKDSILLFAEALDMQNNNEMQDELGIVGDEDEEEDLELRLDDMDGINLEDVDVEDSVEELDNFDDIEDLDTFDEMEEFSEDETPEISAAPTLDFDDGESSFGEDYHRFSLIKSAINKFYQDDRFKSDFLLQTYIADAVGVSSELKKFLQEEMCLDVFIRKIDLGVELCELAKAEKK